MVSIKQSDVNAMKQEATKKGCELAFNLMLAIPAMVIHDKFGSLMMAYKKGYETGYMDRVRGHEYNLTAYAHPPEVLRKIFESSEEEE